MSVFIPRESYFLTKVFPFLIPIRLHVVWEIHSEDLVRNIILIFSIMKQILHLIVLERYSRIRNNRNHMVTMHKIQKVENRLSNIKIKILRFVLRNARFITYILKYFLLAPLQPIWHRCNLVSLYIITSICACSDSSWNSETQLTKH